MRDLALSLWGGFAVPANPGGGSAPVEPRGNAKPVRDASSSARTLLQLYKPGGDLSSRCVLWNRSNVALCIRKCWAIDPLAGRNETFSFLDHAPGKNEIPPLSPDAGSPRRRSPRDGGAIVPIRATRLVRLQRAQGRDSADSRRDRRRGDAAGVALVPAEPGLWLAFSIQHPIAAASDCRRGRHL